MSSLVPKFFRNRRNGFTLVEMLVAVTILTLIMVLATQMIGATSRIWKNTTSKIEAFQNARDGFQLMSDELRQATLNTYWDYFDATGHTSKNFVSTTFSPVAYGRQSELHFRIERAQTAALNTVPYSYGVFFQAPLNYTATPGTYGQLQNLLNGTGFFLEFSDGTNVMNTPPSFLPANPTYRYRLMQMIQPTESMTVYNYSFPGAPATQASAWFTPLVTSTSGAAHATNVRIVANNIIGLFIWAKATDSATDTLTSGPGNTVPTYGYDSRLNLTSVQTPTVAAAPFTWTPGTNSQPLPMNQMPPILHIAMIALDEPSAKVLQGTSAAASAKITAAFGQASAGGGNLFLKPQFMDSDLLTLQTGSTGLASIKPHLNFRVFETTLSVKSARFSTQ